MPLPAQVAAQACHFLLAGFDTMAAALAFTVYHVTRTPGVQDRVLTEVDAFGRAAAPTYDDLDQVRHSFKVAVSKDCCHKIAVQ